VSRALASAALALAACGAAAPHVAPPAARDDRPRGLLVATTNVGGTYWFDLATKASGAMTLGLPRERPFAAAPSQVWLVASPADPDFESATRPSATLHALRSTAGGLAATPISGVDSSRLVAVSPDGVRVAFSCGPRVCLGELATGAASHVRPVPLDVARPRELRWLDGDTLAIMIGGRHATLVTVDARSDRTATHRLAATTSIDIPALAADGSVSWFERRDRELILAQQPLDSEVVSRVSLGDDLEPFDECAEIASERVSLLCLVAPRPRIAPDRDDSYYGYGRDTKPTPRDLVLVEPATATRRTIAHDALSPPVVSPDHRRAAYLAAPATTPTGHHAPVAHIVIVDLATGATRPASAEPTGTLTPIAWLP
jgi:hypothetical protein